MPKYIGITPSTGKSRGKSTLRLKRYLPSSAGLHPPVGTDTFQSQHGNAGGFAAVRKNQRSDEHPQNPAAGKCHKQSPDLASPQT